MYWEESVSTCTTLGSYASPSMSEYLCSQLFLAPVRHADMTVSLLQCVRTLESWLGLISFLSHYNEVSLPTSPNSCQCSWTLTVISRKRGDPYQQAIATIYHPLCLGRRRIEVFLLQPHILLILRTLGTQEAMFFFFCLFDLTLCECIFYRDVNHSLYMYLYHILVLTSETENLSLLMNARAFLASQWPVKFGQSLVLADRLPVIPRCILVL